MKILHTSHGLKASAFFILFSIPFGLTQLIIAMDVPWWNLPSDRVGIWAIGLLCVSLPLSLWVLRGKRWVLFVIKLFAIPWVAVSIWLAFDYQSTPLAIFAVLLFAFWLILLTWIEKEFFESFFDSKMQWYEGLPRPIPGLRCSLKTDTELYNMRVSRFDEKGAFLSLDPFENKHALIENRGRFLKNVELEFSCQDERVAIPAKVMTILPSEKGLGVKFQIDELDIEKSIGDFSEKLKGWGYVE
jgi:hypothetical protein